MTSSANRSPACSRTVAPSAGAQSTSARRGEIGYQTIPSPSIGSPAGRTSSFARCETSAIADGGVVSLAGDRDGDEPAVALLERGAEIAAARRSIADFATAGASCDRRRRRSRGRRGSRLQPSRPPGRRTHRGARSSGRGARSPGRRTLPAVDRELDAGRSRARSPCRARRSGARSSPARRRRRRRRPGRLRPGSRRSGSRSRRASTSGRARRPARVAHLPTKSNSLSILTSHGIAASSRFDSESVSWPTITWPFSSRRIRCGSRPNGFGSRSAACSKIASQTCSASGLGKWSS